MPERPIEELADREPDPAKARASSFRVFAEWLKDNRNALERRLDAQDRKLEEIHSETKRTNGRVTQLETDVKLQEKLADAEREWEDDLDKTTSKRYTRREKRVQWVAGAALMILGSVLGNIGQALGWW